MKDFFYFTQIWIKAEDTTKARKLEGSVTLDDIRNLMRSMGYYPAEMDIRNIANEVKYSRFTETCKPVNKLDLDQLLKVFVNHHPVSGIESEQIQQAFTTIAGNSPAMSKNELLRLLMTEGKAMTDKELDGILSSLIGPSEADFTSQLPSEISADFFIERLLGFEEISDEEQTGSDVLEEASADASYF
jgi:Ca2+-binding EF-hand superfamily protein